MNENRKRVSSVNKIRILAAAALSAAIIGSQVPIVQASETGVIQNVVNSIPENITVENPVALSDIKLPDIEYGTLEWADGSFVPDRRVQSCEAILIPADGVDLSDMEGWDEEAGVVFCQIRVVVSSIESSADYESENDYEEDTPDSSEIPDEITPSVSENPENPDSTSENETQEKTEDEKIEDEKAEDGITEDKLSGNKDDNAQRDKDEKAGGDAVLEEISETDLSKGEETEESSSAEEELTLTEEQTSEQTGAEVNTGQIQGVLEENVSDSSNEQSAPVENIFDNPADFTVKDDRPVQAEDDLTEEEKAERAMINHSCNGIFVSGINLPWYVQFRVSSGEDYEFSNEADAMIFQSYEFELWDLQNNTEYEIPDGEYISVTIPVKEGYDYIIEHLLDNGATETIIPSVEGSTMVFSTHSFSPFGIAGSKQLVGPDFGSDSTISPTPTPTVTPGVKPSQTPGGSSSGTVSGESTGNGSGNSSSAASGGSTSGGITMADNNGAAGTDGSSTGNHSQTYSDTNSGFSGKNDTSSEENSSSENYTQSAGNQSAAKNNAVATGDTTQILPFVILIVAAVVIIGAVFFIRKKK